MQWGLLGLLRTCDACGVNAPDVFFSAQIRFRTPRRRRTALLERAWEGRGVGGTQGGEGEGRTSTLSIMVPLRCDVVKVAQQWFWITLSVPHTKRKFFFCQDKHKKCNARSLFDAVYRRYLHFFNLSFYSFLSNTPPKMNSDFHLFIFPTNSSGKSHHFFFSLFFPKKKFHRLFQCGHTWHIGIIKLPCVRGIYACIR